MIRNAPPPELAAFDFPDGVSAAGQRDETTMPSHALFLLNSPFVIAQAEHFARSVLNDADLDETQRIGEVYRRALGREATSDEVASSRKLLKAVDAELRLTIADEMDRAVNVWGTLCQAVLASSEFRYID